MDLAAFGLAEGLDRHADLTLASRPLLDEGVERTQEDRGFDQALSTPVAVLGEQAEAGAGGDRPGVERPVDVRIASVQTAGVVMDADRRPGSARPRSSSPRRTDAGGACP